MSKKVSNPPPPAGARKPPPPPPPRDVRPSAKRKLMKEGKSDSIAFCIGFAYTFVIYIAFQFGELLGVAFVFAPVVGLATMVLLITYPRVLMDGQDNE